MRLIILLITLIFSFIAFGSTLPSKVNQNILNAYFIDIIGFIGNHIFIFLSLFLVISFLIFRSLKFEIKHPKKNHLLIVATQTCFVFITGIFLSFLLLITIAIIELNFLAYIMDMSPKLLGIQTNIKEITSSLIKNNQSPEILASGAKPYEQLQAIAFATTGTGSFYGKFILNSIPSFLVFPTGELGSTILIDKTIIVSGVKKSDMEQITPIVEYLFIKNYFQDRTIRHFPVVSIMSTNEYVKFRQADYVKKLDTINMELKNTKNLIASTSALIQNDKNDISLNLELVKQSYLQKDKINNDCIAEGEYNKSGVFIHKNSKDYCNNLISQYDSTISKANDNVDLFSRELDNNNKLLKAYQAYADFFDAESKLTNSLKVNIPSELGLYVPENSLKIVMNTYTPRDITDYFETVAHEYLHYASHAKSGKTLTTALFEEGLTEYFARRAIENSLEINTNLGYPVFIKIIEQITKIIPETELADIYFAKDEKALENALDRVYGENFYKNNLILIQTLQFASDNKQLLKYANLLMGKIGGETLKENDLISAPN
jgi:hypothetical protein